MTIKKGAMTLALLSLRDIPSPVIARSGNDEAISSRACYASARNDNKGGSQWQGKAHNEASWLF